MASPLRFAVIAGVGSGTGTSIARRFAQSYPVALLARNPKSYEQAVQEINDKGGKAIGVSADLSDADSVHRAFAQIAESYPKHSCAAAVYNASGPFARKPFLETTLQDYEGSWAVTMYDDTRPLDH
jgi:NAD(P)-dependent dehydrogenase (short-subunit alcohol dehydrogenase family)